LRPRPRPRFAAILAAGAKGRRMEGVHRVGVGRIEGQVEAGTGSRRLPGL
jgi:hypothetical protein